MSQQCLPKGGRCVHGQSCSYILLNEYAEFPKRQTLLRREPPGTDDAKRLINDAVSINQKRYGQVVSVEGSTAHTDTGVEIKFDWNRLSLQQRGSDTDLLDRFYKIHYLQWTGFALLDRALGLIGLALIPVLSLFGLRLAFRPARRSPPE